MLEDAYKESEDKVREAGGDNKFTEWTSGMLSYFKTEH